MKNVSRMILSLMAAGFVSIGFSNSAMAAASDDAAKLKELERAMMAPSDSSATAPTHKTRKRAIVFDNDSSDQSAAAAPTPAKVAASASDCASLPADVKASAVDFAIQFKVGSAALSPASEATVEQIAKILALSPDRCVLVEGHTDAVGAADKNLALSKDRAESVVAFISGKGVERKRLVAIGKGSSDLIKNLDPRDPKNRRVVFKVVAN